MKIPKYALYFNKRENKIKITKQTNTVLCVQDMLDTNKVLMFSDCYYLSDNRNALIDKANEIKDFWIAEYEEKLEALKIIKFKKLKEQK